MSKTVRMIKNLHVILSRYQFPLSTEETLQRHIEGVLKHHGVPYEREYRLDEKNRIDFFCEGLGIEVKIKGSAMSIYRQCERYCQFQQIEAFLLITNKAMGFPQEIKGKPCYVINTGMAWL